MVSEPTKNEISQKKTGLHLPKHSNNNSGCLFHVKRFLIDNKSKYKLKITSLYFF